MAQEWGTVVKNVVPGGAAPSGNGKPIAEHGYKDVGWAAFFWVHALVIVGLAATLGKNALTADAGAPVDDPNRSVLDFNTALFLRVVALACAVGAGSSCLMLWILQRYAGALIKCALYTSVAVQACLTGAMFIVSPIFGIFMAILLAMTLMYVYYVRKRIPFAAAHMETAVAAVRTHYSVFGFAVFSVVLETVWVVVWALAAFGVEHAINSSKAATPNPNGSGGGNSDPNGTSPSDGGSMGSALSFVMLVSLLWGCQVIKYVVSFVVSDTVGTWWFEKNPVFAVSSAIKRAFTTSFGSLALGALLVSVLEALRRFARAAERNARERDNQALMILACLATCIVSCVEGLVEYINAWAIPIMALTGANFTRAGKEALNLFRTRGWEAVVNDNLVHDALNIASIMAASAAGVAGAAIVYIGMPTSPNRGAVAGIAAIFCFIVGFALSALMMSVLAAAVRTVFVAFALDPGALSANHPQYLNKLVSAWNTAHPELFQQCGYAGAYSSQGGAGAYAPPSAYVFGSAPVVVGGPNMSTPLAQAAYQPTTPPAGPPPGYYTGAPMGQPGYPGYSPQAGYPPQGYPPNM